MPDYSVSITDTEKKILDYDIVGISTWINNAVEAKINSTQSIIIAKNTEHCNQNGIAIGVYGGIFQMFFYGFILVYLEK